MQAHHAREEYQHKTIAYDINKRVTWYSAAEAASVLIIGALQIIMIRSWFEGAQNRRAW